MALNADKFLGSLRSKYRASPVAAFVDWWWGELISLVPESVRRRLVAPRPQLIITPHGSEGLEAWRGGGPAVERLAVWNSLDDMRAIRSRLLEIQSEYTDGAPEIRLCLPKDSVLDCQAQLPLAVEGNLGQALKFQLDQITPFRADQVWYDYRVTGRNPETGKIDVDLRLVPRGETDEISKRLTSLGLRPHAIDVAAPGTPVPEGFNLIPEHQRPRYVYRRARINLIMGLGVAVLLALVMAQSLFLRERGLDQLRREARAQQEEARAVMELRQELEDALMAANFLAERRRRTPIAIEVLAEVTEIMPEDVWYQQFRINGRELHLNGFATAAEFVIEWLNESPLLRGPEFRTQTQVDPNTGMERFNVTSQIVTVVTEEEEEAAGGEDEDPS